MLKLLFNHKKVSQQRLRRIGFLRVRNFEGDVVLLVQAEVGVRDQVERQDVSSNLLRGVERDLLVGRLSGPDGRNPLQGHQVLVVLDVA